MSGTSETGRLGEVLAAELLEKLGYNIVARNVHSLYGELDLVATGDGCICFIEVKTRKPGAASNGVWAVTPAKKRRIILTALFYLQNHPTELQPRFDVVIIETDGKRRLAHKHFKGAFEAGNDY